MARLKRRVGLSYALLGDLAVAACASTCSTGLAADMTRIQEQAVHDVELALSADVSTTPALERHLAGRAPTKRHRIHAGLAIKVTLRLVGSRTGVLALLGRPRAFTELDAFEARRVFLDLLVSSSWSRAARSRDGPRASCARLISDNSFCRSVRRTDGA